MRLVKGPCEVNVEVHNSLTTDLFGGLRLYRREINIVLGHNRKSFSELAWFVVNRNQNSTSVWSLPELEVFYCGVRSIARHSSHATEASKLNCVVNGLFACHFLA